MTTFLQLKSTYRFSLEGSCVPGGNARPSSPCSAGPSCEPACSVGFAQPASPGTERGCTQSPTGQGKSKAIH